MDNVAVIFKKNFVCIAIQLRELCDFRLAVICFEQRHEARLSSNAATEEHRESLLVVLSNAGSHSREDFGLRSTHNVNHQTGEAVVPEVSYPTFIGRTAIDFSELIIAGDSRLFPKKIIRLLFKDNPFNVKTAKAMNRIIDDALIVRGYVANIYTVTSKQSNRSTDKGPAIELVGKS